MTQLKGVTIRVLFKDTRVVLKEDTELHDRAFL